MANKLAKKTDVDYIQFKPDAYCFDEYNIETAMAFAPDGNVQTLRFPPKNDLPCKIAGLVGVLAADGNMYFCCQKRGEKKYIVGNIMEFPELNREKVKPNFKKCTTCRYANYARDYEMLSELDKKLLKHKHFL